MKEKTKKYFKNINTKAVFAVLIFFVLLASNCFGQNITWDKIYMQSFATTGTSVKQTSDGNYIVTGWRTNVGGFIVKLNPYGDTLWIKYTPYQDMHSIVESSDGNYVAIGYNYYLYITKYSPNGNQIWAKEIEEPGYDIYAYNIINTNDNCFLVSGYTRLGVPSVRSGYYIKIDQNGNKIWSKIITNTGAITEFLNSQNTAENGYILTGGLNINNNGKIYLVKINSSGDTQWTKSFSSVAFLYGCSVFQTLDKGYIIFGNNEYSNQNIKLYFLKTDSLGNLQWSKIYGDTNTFYQMLYGENATKSKFDNSYYITGFSTDYPLGDTNKIFLLKVDDNGNRLWEKFYKKDTLHLRGFAIDQTSDSGFVVSGDAFDSPIFENTLSDPQYLYVLKLDKNGIINPIGINENNQDIPIHFKLLQNYPNPFNPVTNIKYEIPKDVNVSIKIYDILGKEVFSYNEYKKAGSYEVQFDGTNLASGMYFYKFTADDPSNLETSQAGSGREFVDTKKMVLLK